MKKFKDRSLQVKVSSIYIVANFLVFIVNIVLLISINNMSNKLDMVYQKNLYLNELESSLQDVQDHMTDYLNVRTSDSLENYYRSEQQFAKLIEELNEEITNVSFGRMESNIKNMSKQYLNIVSQTIEAKRGRNVEKYRIRYENATSLYQYINTYISSLNKEQFMYNSENYRKLSKSFALFEFLSIAVMGIVIAGNIFIITNITGTIMNPLKELAESADEIAQGNLNIPLMEIESKDEIGVVTNAFNKMVISIREYIEQIRQQMEIEQTLRERELKMETHLKDAQLKYLQAQINPHFLFNTLNAGAQLAMMEGADRTYDYVQNVADFFRYNIKKSDEIVTLKEELELVDHYINILNVRFSGEIGYTKKIDESLLSVEMPGMILQPIVENCVNHGIREMDGHGEIKIHVFEVEKAVCIRISDNGIGMDQETIQQVLHGTYKEERKGTDSNGIGMDNVINRIRIYTGSDDVIDIQSEGKGLGTDVFIYLPYGGEESEI